MKDIAIVVFASEYNNLGKLPGSRFDALAIKALLETSEQFDEVVFLDGNTSSAKVKDGLAEFARAYSSEDIGTLLFYFSGHGYAKDGEFYHLLSDYSEKNLRQTSLENAELDQILRSLSPNICVKIVDACQSGVSYVKDNTDLRTFISKSKDSFEKLYFMYSSQSNQSSYANERISFLPKAS